MNSQALVPQMVSRKSWSFELAAWATGVGLMALLAQIAIPLPWTPVPVTGQTLGVALVALSWGRNRAAAILLTYIFLGVIGLPVFAVKQGFLLGPTFGYLVGMLLAGILVGWLADRGGARGFWRALRSAYVGSVIIFTCGVWGLSFFIPAQDLLLAGVLPFLPGDLIKNIIAASVSSRFAQH